MLQVQPEAKLRAVIEITRSLAGTVDMQAIVPRILDTLFTIFPQADRGCVLLKDAETANMVPVAQKHRRADADETVKLSRTILNKVLSERDGHPLGRRDERFAVRGGRFDLEPDHPLDDVRAPVGAGRRRRWA